MSSTTTTMALVALAALLIAATVHSLPQGAPETVCDTMLPFHSSGNLRDLPQNSVSPFGIETSTSVVGQGQTLRVDITGVPAGLSFGGFMIQARNRNPPHQIVGQFSPSRDGTIKLMNCENSVNNSATHSNAGPKPQVSLDWQSPVDFLGQVVFNATVAESYHTFWVGIPSNPVQVVRRDAPGLAPLPTTNPPTNFNFASTRAPYVPPSYVAPNSSPLVEDSFYDGCGQTKTCFGFPDGCVATKSCNGLSAITVRGEIFEFELRSGKGSDAAYVALGLSHDAKMGEDLATECVPENGRVNLYSSYTNNDPFAAVRGSVSQSSARLLNASFVDGVIYCKVQRDAVTTVGGRTFDLKNGAYHLLIATGKTLKDNSVGYHDIGRLPSAQPINLAVVQDLSGSSMLLVRLHGAFMIAAWIGTTSLGIIFARYFKQTWVGSQTCGKDQWFAWHRMLMVTTWTLTVVAYILIWVELKRAVWHAHSITGLITVILCFIQPIGALFRPGPNDKSRPYFNWGHWLGGNLAHILAIVAIFFSVKLPKAELPEWMDWILVGFVVFHVLVHLIFSIYLCMNHWQVSSIASDREQSQRVNTFQMGEVSHHHQHAMRNGMSMERKMDAPYGGLRKGLLGVYTIVLALFVVVLILLVVLAPIEKVFG